ncbi:hypothetical protein Ssi03_24440 [Sphaerisporangium siamense]|nr:hypothetical protein Ssi03_24440 [Sphaerisporangium siamense]
MPGSAAAPARFPGDVKRPADFRVAALLRSIPMRGWPDSLRPRGGGAKERTSGRLRRRAVRPPAPLSSWILDGIGIIGAGGRVAGAVCLFSGDRHYAGIR